LFGFSSSRHPPRCVKLLVKGPHAWQITALRGAGLLQPTNKNTIAAVSRPSHYYLIQNTDPSQNELCEQALYRAWLLSAMHLILASATLSFC